MTHHCATGTDIPTPKEEKRCGEKCKCDAPEQMENKMAEIEDQFQRLAAEFDNYRKRSLKEKVESQAIASGKVIESILPVLDDINAAKEQIKDKGTLEIFEKLEKTLFSAGLQKIECEGKNVDLETCEIAFTEPGEANDKITKVIRNGYKLNGKLIRTAIVAVSKKE